MNRIGYTNLCRLLCGAALLSLAGPGQAQEQIPGGPGPSAAASSILNVLVRVEAVTQWVDPARPYTIPEIRETAGTGFIVRGSLVLTDLELVRGARSITITSLADRGRYPARVKFLAADAGLALLETESKDFNRGRSYLPVEPERAPNLGAELAVYGFERSGTLGVREIRPRTVENALIENSDVDRHPLVFLQNLPERGLSAYGGGPAIQDGRLIGLFHNGQSPGDRGTYVIPAAVIDHVLTDVRDGRYEGFPLAMFSYSPARNLDQRRYFGLSDQLGGVIIDRIAFQATESEPLQPGDVLYQIAVDENDPSKWFPVNADGQVIFGQNTGDRRELLRYLHNLQAGRIKVRALRGGKQIERGLLLARNSLFDLRRKRVFPDRSYFLGGGLVFQELDYEIVHEVSHGGRAKTDRLRYRYYYFRRDLLTEQTDREVVLTGILDDPVNAGGQKYVYNVVETINDRRVRTLRDFAREWELNQHRYISIKFLDDPVPLTLEAETLEAADRRIALKFPVQTAGRVR